LPPELENFCAVLTFKRYLSKIGVQKAHIFSDRLRLEFGEGMAIDPARLIGFVLALRESGKNARLHPPAVLELPLDGASVEHSLSLARNLLDPVLKPAA
jgi:transcription-repair coupling factor (superfamily II helicase)